MSHTLPIQSPFSSMPDIPERIARLGVSSLECSIQQTPTAANGNVAVAQTTLAGNGLTVSMPGFATSETANSDKPHLLLNAALMASADNAMHAFEHKHGSVQPRRQGYSPAAEHRASPSKVISPKQEQFINALASKAGRNPEEVAKNLVGKPLGQCSATDADKIIKSLKDSPAENDSVPW